MDVGRILIVDPDQNSRTLVGKALAEFNHVVNEASAAHDALRQIALHEQAMVILELGIPAPGGADLIAEVRKISAVPMIVVSSRTGEDALVDAFLLGADDYLAKPFSARELAVRVNAVLRRSSSTTAATARPVLSFGAFSLNVSSQELSMSGRPIPLRTKEFELLFYLASEPMTVFTREELLRAVWSSSGQWQDPATVTEHIRRVRNRLHENGVAGGVIATVRNAGYRFDPRACRRLRENTP